MRRPSHTLVSLAAVLAAAGCSKGSSKKGPVVAEGDGIAVTAGELKAKIDEQDPKVRPRFSSLEGKKQLLDRLIWFELLVHEAEQQKIDQDPEVKEELRRSMVEHLMRKLTDEKEGASHVSDVEVKKYYDGHLDEFRKPELLRLSHIFLKAEKGSPDRTVQAALANKLQGELKNEDYKSPVAFAESARKFSDDAETKTAGGDLGYRTKEQLQKQYSSELADAAFALQNPGQEALVETPQGFHIVKLIARDPAQNRSLQEATPVIRGRLGREWKVKAFDAFMKRLRERVKINDAELEKIVVTGEPAAQRADPNPPASGQQR